MRDDAVAVPDDESRHVVGRIRKALADALLEGARFIDVERGAQAGDEAGINHQELCFCWRGGDVVRTCLHGLLAVG